MEKDLVLNGYRIGEYSLTSESVYEQIDSKYAEGMNYIAISTGAAWKGEEPVRQEEFIEWAKYLTEKKMYFSFSGGGDYRPSAGFTEETARKMKEIAGDYFLCYALGEIGSTYSCKPSGYKPPFNLIYQDLKEAKDIYIERVARYAKENSMGGVLDTSVVESTSMVNYNCEAGITFPIMEVWPGDVEISLAFTRGTSSAYNCKRWGAYMAHEWYGGAKYDAMKEKRFKMGYDYSYLAGAGLFVNESGDERAGSHGEEKYDFNHPICHNYRKVMADFAKFAADDFRPAGGPKVRVAFVRGNLDGYSFRHSGGSLWRAHQQKEYGYGTPEYAWRILEHIQYKRRWCDVQNYGDVDLSQAPGYGLYDIIPANAGADIFAKYDYLIFVGWNSMTQEIYNDLKEFVKQGGRLFMTAAHLNTSIKRDGEITLLNNGDVSDLFGCVLDSKNPVCRDDGSKFRKSIVPELMYTSLRFDLSDPYFAEGYINYAKTELTIGVAAGRISNTFINKDENEMPISLVENKLGDGYAILMTNLEYPYGAAVPMYQNLVREIFTASHRTADVKVYGGDALRFSVYDGDKVYLLNTDFDNRTTATIDYGKDKIQVTLEPCEFKPVEKPQA